MEPPAAAEDELRALEDEAEAFSLEDGVVDTEAATDEEPDEEVAPPSINRDDAPPPPPAATQTFAAPEFQNTLLYNID